MQKMYFETKILTKKVKTTPTSHNCSQNSFLGTHWSTNTREIVMCN